MKTLNSQKVPLVTQTADEMLAPISCSTHCPFCFNLFTSLSPPSLLAGPNPKFYPSP